MLGQGVFIFPHLMFLFFFDKVLSLASLEFMGYSFDYFMV